MNRRLLYSLGLCLALSLIALAGLWQTTFAATPTRTPTATPRRTTPLPTATPAVRGSAKPSSRAPNAPTPTPGPTVYVQPPCTETEFDAALASLPASGGIVKFNCGASPIDISLSSTKYIGNSGRAPLKLEIDGAGLITFRASFFGPLMFVVGSDAGAKLTFRNLTLRGALNGVVWVRQNAQLEIINCDVLENANYLHSSEVIWNYFCSVVIQNSRLHDNLGDHGGVIYTESGGGGGVFISNSDLYNNRANYAGGVIFITNTANTNLMLDNVRMWDNQVLDYGAGTYVNDVLRGSGGVIYARNSDVTVTGGDWHSNQAAWSGGAFYGEVGTLNITGGNLHSNRAAMEGGALSVSGGMTLTISNTVFYTNAVTGVSGSPYSGNGGAIYLGDSPYWATALITATQFLTNTANNDGGAIRAYHYHVFVYDSALYGNRAKNGGAIFDHYNISSNIKAWRSVFARNAAAQNGGAIRGGGDTDVYDSTFAQNTAGSGGGAIDSNYSETYYSTFSDNSALGDGGAMRLTRTHIVNTLFLRNQAPQGGALRVEVNANIFDSTFQSNQATNGNGGAIRVGESGTIRRSLLQQNSATQSGGAIYKYGSGNLMVDRVRLLNNTAGQDGGAIYDYTNNATSIRQSELSGNTAGGNGGAVMAARGGGSIDYSTLANNHAAQQGGGLYTKGYFVSQNSTFVGNSAAQGGAVFADDGTTLPFYNATIVNNTASNSGGGLYQSGAITITFDSSILDNPVGGNCNGFPTTYYTTLATDMTCGGGEGLIATTSAALKLQSLADNGGNYWIGPPTAQVRPRTMLPGVGSVAIDRASYYPPVDQRDFTRPVGALGDAGAVEVRPGDRVYGVYLPLIRR